MASRGVNKVVIIGNLGGDPDMRYLPNGDAVVSMSVATSEVWKDKATGQPQELTEWHRIILYRKLGEIAGQYLRKGAKVYVEGRLRTRRWTKDGIERFATEIIGASLQMLDKVTPGMPAAAVVPPPASHRGAEHTNVMAPSFDDEEFDDDIPF